MQKRIYPNGKRTSWIIKPEIGDQPPKSLCIWSVYRCVFVGLVGLGWGGLVRLGVKSDRAERGIIWRFCSAAWREWWGPPLVRLWSPGHSLRCPLPSEKETGFSKKDLTAAKQLIQ